ncbi:YkvA family protein [Bosea sp. BIWAKO-01]|uniref:YkvA family protein n=1 Tax=Bosea sp. BIWAKO-01 TaxID=506668 RepID=UPI000853C5EE|nr:YkvA family protein [Bosea sp. BIWAKO-01]
MTLARAKQWARHLKRDVVALWIAARDPRTPWHAKALAAAVAAYALSPIDLIPDFIPILGYLDDLLIVPAGIALAVRLIPSDLMAEFRREAEQHAARPRSVMAASIIVFVWLLALAAVAFWVLRQVR